MDEYYEANQQHKMYALHFSLDFWCLQNSVSNCCSHSCKALRLRKALNQSLS